MQTSERRSSLRMIRMKWLLMHSPATFRTPEVRVLGARSQFACSFVMLFQLVADRVSANFHQLAVWKLIHIPLNSFHFEQTTHKLTQKLKLRNGASRGWHADAKQLLAGRSFHGWKLKTISPFNSGLVVVEETVAKIHATHRSTMFTNHSSTFHQDMLLLWLRKSPLFLHLGDAMKLEIMQTGLLSTQQHATTFPSPANETSPQEKTFHIFRWWRWASTQSIWTDGPGCWRVYPFQLEKDVVRAKEMIEG